MLLQPTAWAVWVPTWAAGGGGLAEEMGGCGRVEVPLKGLLDHVESG